jgi:hypothetical protein
MFGFVSYNFKRKYSVTFQLFFFPKETKTKIHQVLFAVSLSLMVFTPERPWHCVNKSVSINHAEA